MSAYSICIPRVFNNIPNRKIIQTFENLDLGKVENIDVVYKISKNGTPFKMAFIHFSEWNYYNSAAINLKEKIENPNIDAKIVYDDPWHWILLPNSSNVANCSNTPVSSLLTSNFKNEESKLLEERLTNLENELNCVYEELYQREYIPTKYRQGSHWDCDKDMNKDMNKDMDMDKYIEEYMDKGVDTHSNQEVTPMTISELDLDESPDITYVDMDDDSELHTPPRLSNYIQITDNDDNMSICNGYDSIDDSIDDDNISLLSCVSHQYSNSPYDYSYDYSYDVEKIASKKAYVPMVNKLWMTTHCCGNN